MSLPPHIDTRSDTPQKFNISIGSSPRNADADSRHDRRIASLNERNSEFQVD